LVRKIGLDQDDYYIAQEAKSRIEDLRGKYKLPESIDETAKLLDKLGIAETADEIRFSNGVLGKIIIKFAGDPEFTKTIEQAEEILEKNRIKLDDLESQPNPGRNLP
jgi:hypothetical protein